MTTLVFPAGLILSSFIGGIFHNLSSQDQFTYCRFKSCVIVIFVCYLLLAMGLVVTGSTSTADGKENSPFSDIKFCQVEPARSMDWACAEASQRLFCRFGHHFKSSWLN